MDSSKLTPIMKEIKILGTGCPKCKTLEKLTSEVVMEQNLVVNITKEEDIVNIMSYGIMHTPGLVVDGKVVMSGRVPTKNEILDLIR